MLTGTAATDASGFDIAITGNSTDLALGIPQADPFLAGAATLQGRAIRTGPLSGALRDLALTTPTLSLTADASVIDGIGSADFALALDDVAPALPDLAGALDLSGTVTRDAAGVVTADVTGDGPGGAAVSLAATLGAGFDLAADIDATVDDLSPYSALAGQDLAGALTLTATGTAGNIYQPMATDFDVVFDASVRDLVAGPRRLTGTLAANGIAARAPAGDLTLFAAVTGPGALDLNVQGTMAPRDAGSEVAGTLTLSAADLGAYSALVGEVLSGALDVSASGAALPDLSTLDLTFDLSGRDLSGYGYGLDGAVTARGTATRDATGAATAAVDATGPGGLVARLDGSMATEAQGNEITGQIDLAASDLSAYSGLAGQPFAGSVDLTASGNARPDATTFDLAFDLAGENLAGLGYRLAGALEAQGTATRTPDGVTAIDATASGPGGAAIDLDASLAAPADGGQIRGALLAQVASLAPWSDLAGRSLAGSLDLDVSGMAWPDLSGFDVDFDVTGADLSAGGIALPGGLSARGQALRQSDGVTSIDIDGTGPGGAEFRVTAGGTDTVTVDARASVDSLSTYAGLIGQPIAGGVSAAVRGTTALDFSTFDLALDAETRSLDVGVPAAAPLLAGVGRIDGQVSRSADGTLRAQGLDVTFPGFSVSGDFDSVNGAGGGTFQARLNDIGQFVPDFSGPVTADGSARLQPGGGIGLDIDATGPAGISATVRGEVAPGGALALTVDGQAPLALADPFIEPRTLTGNAGFALSVNGPPALSSVTGTVTLTDGRLFAPTLGRALEDIGGTIQLTGGQAILGLGASLDAGGRLNVTGPVGLAAPNVADIRIAADRLIVRDPNLFETTANGLITITGPLAGGARIAGTIDIGETEIRVPSSGISVLGDLPEVEHVGAPPAVRATLNRAGLTIAGVEPRVAGGGGPAYVLDLLIRAPARIFIRGRGVDAELGGELAITGTTANVIPVGQFELVRGRVDILQQRFDLDEGGAYLQGDFVPFIRLVATTETTDSTKVSVIVEGPADDPEVRFVSEPDLPQDEVLARLIFGRDLSSITPLQAVQLAAAVSTLAGRGGGGLIDDFRSGSGSRRPRYRDRRRRWHRRAGGRLSDRECLYRRGRGQRQHRDHPEPRPDRRHHRHRHRRIGRRHRDRHLLRAGLLSARRKLTAVNFGPSP